MNGQRLLVVEDDPFMVDVYRGCLEREGYRVHVVCDGKSALEAMPEVRPDLVVLDVRLPGMDGLAVCRELRKQNKVPILMVSSRADDVDKIVGLELGADDYLAKPFNPRELLARVRALLRRWEAWAGEAAEPSDLLVRGRLTIDVRAHRVEVGGQEVRLSPLEFSLLRYLASNPGQVLSRQALLDAVWGHDFVGDERTVDSHVGQVRKKLRQVDPGLEPIVSVRGVGYKFEG